MVIPMTPPGYRPPVLTKVFVLIAMITEAMQITMILFPSFFQSKVMSFSSLQLKWIQQTQTVKYAFTVYFTRPFMEFQDPQRYIGNTRKKLMPSFSACEKISPPIFRMISRQI